MKPEELMVGDFVKVNKDVCIKKDTIVEIRSIDADNVFFKRKLKGSVTCVKINDPCEYGVWLDFLSPIPLTPEILEKNGFITEEREGDPTFPYLAFIIENDEYRVEITWYDSHDVYEQNTGEYLLGAPEVWNMEILGKCGNYDCGKNKLFVHELQHALKLCGIEKEIEL